MPCPYSVYHSSLTELYWHIAGTPQMQRLLKRGLAAHVFDDETTMNQVAQAIIENGDFTGIIRGYQRYGMWFLRT
jgi:hypothetical protein